MKVVILPVYDGEPLPQELREMTVEQVRQTIEYLARLPMKKLRRNQDIIYSQQRLAHEEEQRPYFSSNPGRERGLRNLGALETLYTYAVMKQAFKETDSDYEYILALVQRGM